MTRPSSCLDDEVKERLVTRAKKLAELKEAIRQVGYIPGRNVIHTPSAINKTLDELERTYNTPVWSRDANPFYDYLRRSGYDMFILLPPTYMIRETARRIITGDSAL